MGGILAKRIAITDLPQMVAGFHSLVGLAAVATSVSSYLAHGAADPVALTATFLGALIGTITMTGHCLLHVPPCFHPVCPIKTARPEVFDALPAQRHAFPKLASCLEQTTKLKLLFCDIKRCHAHSAVAVSKISVLLCNME